MRGDSGTALLELIVIGFAVTAIALSTLVAVLRLSEAQGRAHAIASEAALWHARHGTDPPGLEAGAVGIERSDGIVTVTARESVHLIDVAGIRVGFTVTEQASAMVSLYRSDR